MAASVAGTEGGATAGGVILKFGFHQAADLDAGVGAGDIPETRPIQATDLHVFDRLGFDRQVSRLGTGHRKHAGRRPQKYAFHWSHMSPPNDWVIAIKCELRMSPTR